MGNRQEFQDCRHFISAGKLDKALEIINKLDRSHQLSNDEDLIRSHLKSEIHYRYGEYEKAENLSRLILEKSHNQGNQLQAVEALIMISTILWRVGKFPESLKSIEEAEKIITLLGENTSQEVRKRTAMLMYRRGTIYTSLGDLNKGRKYAKKSSCRV
jgi:tetratricopeptide (TPR) repeat protein